MSESPPAAVDHRRFTSLAADISPAVALSGREQQTLAIGRIVPEGPGADLLRDPRVKDACLGL